MKILKFGGTSVGTPERISNVINLLASSFPSSERIAVVVSAFGKVTDELLDMSTMAARGDDRYHELFQKLATKHIHFTEALVKKNQKAVLQNVNDLLNELKDVVHGVFLVKELSPKTRDFVMSFGERLSCYIISEAMKETGRSATYLDARRLIKTDENFGAARVDFATTNRNIRSYFETRSEIQIITGFIGSTDRDETTTLGRGGSDYTASIVGAALDAAEVQIWTDVDGVMTADPRKVGKAFPLRSLTYEEAMEMSHFGAQVIHPPTMQPVLLKNIPLRILNTLNPEFPGTLISDRAHAGDYLIKGITSIPEIALLLIQGSGMVGVTGTAERIFRCLAQERINVLLITQASSEHSICIAVAPGMADKAAKTIENEFKLEIQTALLDKPIVETSLAVVAIVGENMRHSPGISGRFFHALGRNGVNVKAIAQGSSERNISVVISSDDEAKALNAVHEAFFLSDTMVLYVFMIGSGLIGRTLLRQLEEHRAFLRKERHLDIDVLAIANSRKMLFDEDGIREANWQDRLNQSAEAMDLHAFVDRMKRMNFANSVFVDCTASEAVAVVYEDILKSNIAIVTPNKKACSGDFSLYNRIKQVSVRTGTKFLFETNVGAGLPVIGTLNDLISSGDKVISIEAVLSGTLSYLFNTYDGRQSFSEVLRRAMQMGLTEPDPRDDLNGLDVARKLLILAREAGHALELKDISVENLVPEQCRRAASVDEFFSQLKNFDASFESRHQQAAREGRVLRYVAALKNGSAATKLVAIEPTHPFYGLSGSDNVIAFTTDRYADRPLVIKGPGAGAEVTAAGVFADIIRISN